MLSIKGSVSYIIGKHDLDKSHNGWINTELPLEDWYAISSEYGHAICAELKDGHRANANVLSRQLFYLDIDDAHVTLQESLSDDFVKARAAYIYTTCNYKEAGPQKHRIAYAIAEPLNDHDDIRNLTYALIYAREYPYLDNPIYDATHKRKTRCDAACIDPSRLYTGNPTPAHRYYFGNVISMDEVHILIDEYAAKGKELIHGRPAQSHITIPASRTMQDDDKQSLLESLMTSCTILVPSDSYRTIHKIANAMLNIGYMPYDVDCVVRHIGQCRADINKLIINFADRQNDHNSHWSGNKVGYTTIKQFLQSCGHPDYITGKTPMPSWVIPKIRKIIISNMSAHDTYLQFYDYCNKYIMNNIGPAIVSIFADKYPAEKLHIQQLTDLIK